MQRLYALLTASPSPTAAAAAGEGQGSHATVHRSTTSSAPPPLDGARNTSTTSGSPGDGSGRCSAEGGGGGAWSGRWNHLSRLRNAAAGACGRGARTARIACSALRRNCGTISSAPARPPPPPPAESDRLAIAEPESSTDPSATPQHQQSNPLEIPTRSRRSAWLQRAATRPHKSGAGSDPIGGCRSVGRRELASRTSSCLAWVG
uniref:Uncharacterized protein n=1 Tax=Arundo donax TaxID=35708 RepID=A0A0A9F557_ARUDO